SAGRCIAWSTSSGMLVGPGRARISRPARTVIVVIPCAFQAPWMQPIGANIKIAAALFGQRFRDRMPDLIFQFTRRRPRQRGDEAVLLAAVLDQPQDPRGSEGHGIGGKPLYGVHRP